MASDFLQAVIDFPEKPITAIIRYIKNGIFWRAFRPTQICILDSLTVRFPSSHFYSDSQFTLERPSFFIKVRNSIVDWSQAFSVWRRVWKFIFYFNGL